MFTFCVFLQLVLVASLLPAFFHGGHESEKYIDFKDRRVIIDIYAHDMYQNASYQNVMYKRYYYC